MKKKITVVTVTFNAGSLLEKTIKSVVSQSYDNYEYIIIDGGSTDNTLEIINKHNDSISYFESEPDDGIYHAMNKGIDRATGVWTIFMNAGDEFADNSVLDKVSEQLDEEYDFVYGDRYRVNSKGCKKLEYADVIDKTLQREVVFHQALFNKTEYLKSTYYNICYKLAADYDFIVSSFIKGKKFKKIPYAICNFLEGGRSREQYLLAQLEASIIIIENSGDQKALKNNMYFENLIKVNIGYTLNKYAQIEKSKNNDFSLRVNPSPINNNILSTNYPSCELNDFLKRINEPLSRVLDTNYSKKKRVIFNWISKLFSYVSRKFKNKQLDADVILACNKGSTRENPKDATNQNKKISVVTVVLNAEDLIEKTIRSVLSQSYKNLEYIVIDGDSSDATNDIIDKYKDKITTYLSEKDDGLYFAMNKGIELSNGDYIIFMNAGDTLSNKDVLLNLCETSDMKGDVVYGDRYYIDRDKVELQKAKNIDTIFQRMPFGHQSSLVKRSILERYKFNTFYKFAADYELFVKLYKKGHSFEYADIPISNFESGGLSESGIKPYIEVLKILFDNCDDKETIKNSVYFRGFKNTFSDLIDF